MASRKNIPFTTGTFFITFTCYNWLPLIEKINGYDIVYNWFKILKSKGHSIHGYVIMPNHVHVLISFVKSEENINKVIGNGKRFMAYDIIKYLRQMDDNEIISALLYDRKFKRIADFRLHNVWEHSFDWKSCKTLRFMQQKLDYIHNNPCVKKWNLAKSPIDYLHSSAAFYAGVSPIPFPVTNIMESSNFEF